jgi:hypothetical protein
MRKIDEAINKPPVVHPLTRFEKYPLSKLTAEPFVLDDLICDQTTLIAGSPGVGKTTQLVPLFTRVAWLCSPDDELRPTLRRRVIYIAEDTRQVAKILAAMYLNGDLGTASEDDVRDWFRVVPAKRLPVEQVTEVAALYRELAYLNRSAQKTYEALPLVVFDTANASFEIENENDNAQVGDVIAALKQEFQNVPIVVVSHIAKGLKRADVADFSVRGAGAWEGDATQVCYLVKESDDGETNSRWLEIGVGKHRFVEAAKGIRFDAKRYQTMVDGLLGGLELMTVLYGLPTMVDAQTLADQRQERKEQALKQREVELRSAALDAVKQLWEKPVPGAIPNRTRVVDLMRVNKTVGLQTVEILLTEGWLIEIDIPKDRRINSKNASVLYRMDSEQHKAYVDTAQVPVTTSDIPAAWLKPISSVPKTNGKLEPTGAESVVFVAAGAGNGI